MMLYGMYDMQLIGFRAGQMVWTMGSRSRKYECDLDLSPKQFCDSKIYSYDDVQRPSKGFYLIYCIISDLSDRAYESKSRCQEFAAR